MRKEIENINIIDESVKKEEVKQYYINETNGFEDFMNIVEQIEKLNLRKEYKKIDDDFDFTSEERAVAASLKKVDKTTKDIENVFKELNEIMKEFGNIKIDNVY